MTVLILIPLFLCLFMLTILEGSQNTVSFDALFKYELGCRLHTFESSFHNLHEKRNSLLKWTKSRLIIWFKFMIHMSGLD